MKTLYLECHMGAAGDMLCGALLDMLNEAERQRMMETIASFSLKGVNVSATPSVKCGITGTQFHVDIEGEHSGHHHTSIEEIDAIIDGFALDDKTKADAKAVYRMIAEAESKVHGRSVAEVHLHEVGAKDAIIDVTCACLLFRHIGAERIVCSPVTVGYGSVKTAHGVMSVPAPATAILLKGIPTKSSDVEGELCTPTGAALLRYFADEFTEENQMTVQSIGYGMGSKDFAKPNCVRAFLGETEGESIYELRCQVDDMTGEEMGYCLNKMLALGANDAFVQSIVMKKSRPAMLLTVICPPDKRDYFTRQIFKHTTTLGVRQVKCTRSILDRTITEDGAVHIKKAYGFGVEKEKTEFDELAKIADERDISVFDARKQTKNVK